MQEKKCSRCREVKDISFFNYDKNRKDGYYCYCTDCIRKINLPNKDKIAARNKVYKTLNKDILAAKDLARRRTKVGLIKNIYHCQCSSSTSRGHNMPEYTVDDLISWALDQEIFHNLFEEWVNSGYDKYKKPSFDRTNDKLGYSLKRLTITDWWHNKRKCEIEVKLGIKDHKLEPVVKLDKDYNFIESYHSLMEADRNNDCDFRNIQAVCKGRRNFAGNFRWMYVEDYFGCDGK